MANPSSTLITQSRMALAISQQQFADLCGVAKRTIQRWEDRGSSLMPWHAEKLVEALRPVRPDLADRVRDMARDAALSVGVPTTAAAGRMTRAERVRSVLEAAAKAGDTTIKTARTVVAAAFVQAREVGIDVKTVIDELVEVR